MANTKKSKRLVPQSMSGISVDDALRGALQVPLPDELSSKKKRKAKKKPKKRAKK